MVRNLKRGNIVRVRHFSCGDGRQDQFHIIAQVTREIWQGKRFYRLFFEDAGITPSTMISEIEVLTRPSKLLEILKRLANHGCPLFDRDKRSRNDKPCYVRGFLHPDSSIKPPLKISEIEVLKTEQLIKTLNHFPDYGCPLFNFDEEGRHYYDQKPCYVRQSQSQHAKTQ